MSKYRRHKKSNYTCIDNQVFKDHSLSMKAKGLLTQIYSLPENWDYSVRGLSTLFSDGRDAVNNALQELIDHGYIVRTQKIDNQGKFDGYEYDIYETPQIKNADNPFTENPSTENPMTENTTQLNTKEDNTKLINTKEDIYIVQKSQKAKFIPPTIEEVRDYCDERGNDVDSEKFISYYESNGWMVGRNHMKDWKAAIRTWEKNSYGKPLNSSPSYQKPSGNPFADLLEKWEDEDE